MSQLGAAEPGLPKLTRRERHLLEALLGEEASVSKGLQLHARLSRRSTPFPLSWEERLLALTLRDDPARGDLVLRYRQVLLLLGKPVPLDIERRAADLLNAEEREVDYQSASAQYHEQSGGADVDPAF